MNSICRLLWNRQKQSGKWKEEERVWARGGTKAKRIRGGGILCWVLQAPDLRLCGKSAEGVWHPEDAHFPLTVLVARLYLSQSPPPPLQQGFLAVNLSSPSPLAGITRDLCRQTKDGRKPAAEPSPAEEGRRFSGGRSSSDARRGDYSLRGDPQISEILYVLDPIRISNSCLWARVILLGGLHSVVWDPAEGKRIFGISPGRILSKMKDSFSSIGAVTSWKCSRSSNFWKTFVLLVSSICLLGSFGRWSEWERQLKVPHCPVPTNPSDWIFDPQTTTYKDTFCRYCVFYLKMLFFLSIFYLNILKCCYIFSIFLFPLILFY